MLLQDTAGLQDLLAGAAAIKGNAVEIIDAGRLRGRLDALVYNAVFHESESLRRLLAWLIRRAAAAELIYPASAGGLYAAAIRGEAPRFTAPALSLRTLPYDAARACFRAAAATNCGALVFDLVQGANEGPAVDPTEYSTCILAAALRERFKGPVFLQVAHLHERPPSSDDVRSDELIRLQDLAEDALAAGLFNVELDTTDLEDDTAADPAVRVREECGDAARLAAFIRAQGPAGGHASLAAHLRAVPDGAAAPQRLRAFMASFGGEYGMRAGAREGLDKLVLDLPGSGDVEAAHDLAEIAEREFAVVMALRCPAPRLAAVLDHPPGYPVTELHLGTRYEDVIMEHERLPASLRDDMRTWVNGAYGGLRGPDQDEAAFFEALRVPASLQYKQGLWDMPPDAKTAIMTTLEELVAEDLQRLRAVDTVTAARRLVRMHDFEGWRPGRGYFHDVETAYHNLITT